MTRYLASRAMVRQLLVSIESLDGYVYMYVRLLSNPLLSLPEYKYAVYCRAEPKKGVCIRTLKTAKIWRQSSP